MKISSLTKFNHDFISDVNIKEVETGGDVARTGEKGTEHKILVGKSRGSTSVGFVIKKYVWMTWTGLICLRLDTSDRLL